MKDITIPPAALEAGARALARIYEREFTCDIDRQWPEFVDEARAAFVAMVAEWPMWTTAEISAPGGDLPALILPLAAPSGAIMENPDDKA